MENDSFNSDGSIYNPFQDPVLIQRSRGDPQYLTQLARVELARLNQENLFSNPEATDNEREAARTRLSEQKNGLLAYMSEHGYLGEID